MKKNLQDFFYNAEALILLAEILHKVLASRGRWRAIESCHKKNTNIDKRFEEIFKRLHKSIDYRADKADKMLKCKITSMALPENDTTCINISNLQPKKLKTKTHN